MFQSDSGDYKEEVFPNLLKDPTAPAKDKDQSSIIKPSRRRSDLRGKSN
jgi:hypothetical protein